MRNWVNVSKQYLPLLGSTAPGKTLPAFVEILRKFRGRPLAASIKRKAKSTYSSLLYFKISQNITLRVMFFETIRNAMRNASLATWLRHCFERLQHCSNTPTFCCAKNCRCESSRVTSPERSWIMQFIQPSCFEIDFEYHSELWKKYCVFTWRHGGHVGVPIQSCRIWNPSWVNAFFCSNKFAQMLATWVETLNTPKYRWVIWSKQ